MRIYCNKTCLQKEIRRENGRRGAIKTIKHGHISRGRHSRTYNTWIAMIRRCGDPKFAHFENYGGRGIMVCDGWRDFINFLEDMGKCPDGMFLERINNNGDYYKGNCRWATHYDQVRNTSMNVWVELGGEHMIITDALKTLNMVNQSDCRRFYAYMHKHELTHQETVDYYSR